MKYNIWQQFKTKDLYGEKFLNSKPCHSTYHLLFFLCLVFRDVYLRVRRSCDPYLQGTHFSIIRLFKFCPEVLSVLMLCAPVFIFTYGSSALLGRPTLWFIDPTVAILAIFNTLFWIYGNFSHEKMDKTRKCSKTFSYKTKWPPTVTRRAKHQYWEGFFKEGPAL